MHVNPAPLDASLCPLCGAANACAMELERSTGQAQGPCWCVGLNFSAELLVQVPLAAQNAACICPACYKLNS